MNETQIFNSYADFLKRTNELVNGVSKEFAKNHPDYINQNQSNTGCWNCSFSINCIDCVNCHYAHMCDNCTDSSWMDMCINCKNMDHCEYMYNSTHCTRSENCGNCHGCSNVFSSYNLLNKSNLQTKRAKYIGGKPSDIEYIWRGDRPEFAHIRRRICCPEQARLMVDIDKNSHMVDKDMLVNIPKSS